MATVQPSVGRMISIHLEDGVDSADLRETDVSISRRGMELRSRWCFSPGSELVITIEQNPDPLSGEVLRFKVEGIVAHSEELPESGIYETIVLFLDAPEILEYFERSDAGAFLVS